MKENRRELNRNLAQMLKGGVIMDVTTPEQARIAEAAVKFLSVLFHFYCLFKCISFLYSLGASPLMFLKNLAKCACERKP